MHSRSLPVVPAIAAVAALAATGAGAGALKADITRTAYGIPHVVATDYAGLGFGSAYAFAQDNVCLLADQIVTVSGDRSKYFGAGGTTTVSFNSVKNLDSDIFFKATLDGAQLRRAAASASADYRHMLHGYVAGYNAYLRRTGPANLPAACRNAAWVRPITDDDLLKIVEEKMTQASAGTWLASIVAAAPPASGASHQMSAADTQPDLGDGAGARDVGLGSNGWAFGREATGGAGVLVGNPHFPWQTTNRFYQIHLTIPGKLDVMGATLSGIPGVSIGFNHDVAWTHTVSTDRHFTVFELALDPGDPTAYTVDGKRLAMQPRTVTVTVKDGPPVTRTLYTSLYGPLIVRPLAGLAWTREHAYALKDADHLNIRAGDTWLDIARSRSVAEIRQAIGARVGIPWVNTIAADRAGEALYADITSTPNVTDAQLKACAPASPAAAGLAAHRLFVLNGARAACDWTVDPASPVPGLMPASAMPSVVRRDFVANSNDSFWLANDAAPVTGFSPLVGLTAETQSLRTRIGLIEIHEQLAGRTAPAITPRIAESLMFSDRVYGAELMLDDILAACADHPMTNAADGRAVDLKPACAVLAAWDRHMNVDSVGAALFTEVWKPLSRDDAIFATPFDPADPVHTPRGLKRDAATNAKVAAALAGAVSLMAERGEALDAPWGKVQVAVRGDEHIPVHGGPGNEDGVLDAQQSNWVAGAGYVPFHGSSYVQVVTFDAKGPVADAVLSYSQSTNPASPHYADQTRLFSAKQWNRLPFSAADVKAQAVSHEHVEE